MPSALPLLVLLLALQGCWGGFTRWQFSQPHLAGDRAAPEGIVTADGVRIAFFADNVRKREYTVFVFFPVATGDEQLTTKSTATFNVELRIEPTAPGALRLDPERVRLTRDTGAVIGPARFRRSISTAPRGRLIGRVEDPRDAVAAVLGLKWTCTYGRDGTEVDGPTCFDLEFPTAPLSPHDAFVLRIDGLTRDGVPMPVPEIRFRPAKIDSNSYYCMFLILCGP